MRYSVTLNEERYIVDVDCCEQPTAVKNCGEANSGSIKNIDSDADGHKSYEYSKVISYEAVKLEYESCIHRSEKLDNKIYIMLTVYAFIFALLTSSINQINQFAFPKDMAQLALIIIFSLLLFIDLLIYFISLTNMVSLIKAVHLNRFVSGEVIDKELMGEPEMPVMRYVLGHYVDCININNSILEDRYEKFNRTVYAIVIVLVISILIAILENFIMIKV
ncbi:MAG: hypothetical protein LUG83_10935 [Lachnospiraceae bacterium]|nr:hypothetical protein [Lachnospiraceae bacterium]